MSLFTQFRRKLAPRLPAMARQHVADDIVGDLKFDGEHWFVGSVLYGGSRLRVMVAAGESDIDAASLTTTRKVSSDLPVMIERACDFLATFPGFRGIERVRAIFHLSEGVFDGEEGCFYLVFHCTEDRDPEARWRVHFRDWQPYTQGRDS
jgi:hypothetical protein